MSDLLNYVRDVPAFLKDLVSFVIMMTVPVTLVLSVVEMARRWWFGIPTNLRPEDVERIPGDW